jgi:hypothetical protein
MLVSQLRPAETQFKSSAGKRHVILDRPQLVISRTSSESLRNRSEDRELIVDLLQGNRDPKGSSLHGD